MRLTGNKIGDAGAEALGPHLAKLSKMTHLNLGSSCLLVVVMFVGWWQCDVTRALVVGVVTGNCIGNEGAKALGPHLAKLSNMTCLELHSACLEVFSMLVDCVM